MKSHIRPFQQLQSGSIRLDHSVLNSQWNTILGDYAGIYYKYLMIIATITPNTNQDLIAKCNQHLNQTSIKEYIPKSKPTPIKSAKLLTRYNRTSLYDSDQNGTTLLEKILTTVSNFIQKNNTI